MLQLATLFIASSSHSAQSRSMEGRAVSLDQAFSNSDLPFSSFNTVVSKKHVGLWGGEMAPYCNCEQRVVRQLPDGSHGLHFASPFFNALGYQELVDPGDR
ncbi:unnamed protein product [Sphagnum jensenii]|uniref:Uncharacterized protein n=1 Tax=Sphagnum jensenii TaxID=128206 RepID=A0ABP1BZK4_9BRYO